MTKLEDDGGTFGPLGGEGVQRDAALDAHDVVGTDLDADGVFCDGSMGVPSPSTSVTPKCVEDILLASLTLATDSMKILRRSPEAFCGAEAAFDVDASLNDV